MTIAKYLEPLVEAAAKKMIVENLESMRVENGLFLVKEDSSEGQKKLKEEGVVAHKVPYDNVNFLLCNS